VNLTVGLIQGNICGEIEIGFEVSNSNRSFTATGILLWCMNLHKAIPDTLGVVLVPPDM
jgi:hypothetical protein